MSNTVQVSPQTLTTALQKQMKEGNAMVTLSKNERQSIKLPIKTFKTPRNGPVSPEFLKENGINIFHYTEPKVCKVPSNVKTSDEIDEILKHYAKIMQSVTPKRRITIAYKFTKGKNADGKETMERFVTYGAVVFRKDTKKEDSDANPDDNDVKPNNEETDTDNVELYDKSAHTWTAINRLMNYGVSVKLYFKDIPQFKQDLRKCLFKHGVCTRNKTTVKPSFKIVREDITNVLLTTVPNDSPKSVETSSKPGESSSKPVGSSI